MSSPRTLCFGQIGQCVVGTLKRVGLTQQFCHCLAGTVWHEGHSIFPAVCQYLCSSNRVILLFSRRKYVYYAGSYLPIYEMLLFHRRCLVKRNEKSKQHFFENAMKTLANVAICWGLQTVLLLLVQYVHPFRIILRSSGGSTINISRVNHGRWRKKKLYTYVPHSSTYWCANYTL